MTKDLSLFNYFLSKYATRRYYKILSGLLNENTNVQTYLRKQFKGARHEIPPINFHVLLHTQAATFQKGIFLN